MAPGRRRGEPLLQRVRESAQVLFETYKGVAAAARRQEPITPAAEWLLDNFHIVEEQLEDIRKHLPGRYYTELPKLENGPWAGYPRVYALALELISHSDGALDEHTLVDAVRAYQESAPLGLGELWAVAIMLRVGLVENLRRLTAPLERQRLARAEADTWAERVMAAAGGDPGEVQVILGELARRRSQLTDTHVVRLIQRLRGRGPAVTPVLEWLEQHQAQKGIPSVEELVRFQNQLQAADQVSISNTIGSFRLLGMIDWTAFVEETSHVHAALALDPAGVFTRMDFRTRDACRHQVERIGRRSPRSEVEIAEIAVSLARAHSATGENGSGPPELGHVGYYLIGEGVRETERRAQYRPTLRERALRGLLEHPTLAYLGGIGVFTALFVWLAVSYAAGRAVEPWLAWAAGLLALIPGSDLAVSLVNRLLTLTLPPRVLPKMDFSRGLPAECRALVVIPTLITSEEGVDELLERLEVHYLANPDPNLHFALLTDFGDSDTEDRPEDVALLHRAVSGILTLNERYEGANQFNRFFLFHRPRKWNPVQGVWMGWERKRGKLVELNRLLRGATDTSYTICIGDRSALEGVRYVITLDTDTQLPSESARKLVATLAHPLNQARIDPARRCVVKGYGILQPRVSIALPSAGQSLFTRIFSGNAGVDPYTTAVSDVYQDLFGEGIFCGKGIYDIDAFEECLEGRVPENTLLSHDLFEGSFARCGLATDIEFFDDYPARYNTYSARQHRWIRGDWQLLPWLFPRVRTESGAVERNPLSVISRWKMFDNMRRSLAAPALVLLLAAGWTFLPGHPWVWTGFALLVTLFPIYFHLANTLFVDPRGVPWTSYFWRMWGDVWTDVKVTALTLTFIPHQAITSVDAIVRTLWRRFVSHRNLLEWTTAAAAERRLGSGLDAFWKRMWPVTAGCAALLAAIASLRQEAMLDALPFLAVWAASPWIAWRVSQPLRERLEPLTPGEIESLRLAARRTWLFFEDVVTAADHWLPPDNYQEDRTPKLAHRTSPTNMGLLLLSTVSARDLGYLGLLELVDRLERTLWNMVSLERYRGHFYNWYETEGATAIQPFYISSVDSGNLAGHLLALKQAAQELLDAPVFSWQTLPGLRDTACALREELGSGASLFQAEFAAFWKSLEGKPFSAPTWQQQLDGIRTAAVALVDAIAGSAREQAGPVEDPTPGARIEAPPAIEAWCTRLLSQIGELQRDLDTLLPWSRLIVTQPAPFSDGRPLTGDLTGRPHVFSMLVTPPQGLPRALTALAEVMDRALAETYQLEERLRLMSIPDEVRESARRWLKEVQDAFERCRHERITLIQRLNGIIATSAKLVEEMDFTFLYDSQRDLFAVGYDVTNGRLDNYHYDLLASECRLASFVAIGKRDVPQKHWFRMGRALTGGREDRALVSWSGTMFEYFMPLLVMRAYEGTLLARTLPAVVRKQMRFAQRERVPWGISESAFNARDQLMNYQYRAFGVPGLGLKPDLSEDLVVSPYSTFLALPVCPKQAVRNLEQLAREGAACRYGFYEAVDYTPSRLPRGSKGEVVRSLMAHHQGMALISLANYLVGPRMQDRFHNDPMVKANELLLQERNPREAQIAHPKTQQVLAEQLVPRELPPAVIRHYTTAQTSTPRVQLLSNGRYSVMVTNSGGGYSLWRDLAITRWREDVTRDSWGTFLYLRDVRTGQVWSAAQQPLAQPVGDYEVFFTEDKAEFQRRLEGIVSRLEIAVSAEDDVEVRRLTLTNTTDAVRELEITSYAEVVLARPAADLAHSTFSNLFVETDFLRDWTALLATRRPRSENQARHWAVHVVAHEGVPAEIWDETHYETDRMRFLGRGRTPANPAALDGPYALSRTTGPVLDPVFSLRQRVRIPPRATVQVAFTTGAAASREEAERLAERYHDLRAASRAFDLAWTHSQVELRHLGLSADDAHLCQRLASRVLYADAFVRPPAEVLARNTLGQSGLWPYGISGDVPIVLAQVSSFDHLGLVRQLLIAHEYLRLKGLVFDLVILNEHPPSYIQAFDHALHELAQNEGATLDHPGGVFLRRAEFIPDAGRNLLLFVARAVFHGDHGSLTDQLDWRPERKEPPQEFEPSRLPLPPHHLQLPEMDLLFHNGLGGFDPQNGDYIIGLGRGRWTPAPWINVISNERFGCLASEAGSGFTWSENSRENRLTPWSNDPVSDTPPEAIYLRHEDTGRLWSVTPLPIREGNPYVIRHGAGFTRYEHDAHGVEQELTVYVSPAEPVKIYRLRLINSSERVQRLSATLYAEWVLGVSRELTHPYVATWQDGDTGAILARNAYNGEFAHRIAFADVSRPERSWTADRTEFLGRNGHPARPRGLGRVNLAQSSGTQLDPCAAIQVKFSLQPGAETVIVFTIGQGEDVEEARTLARKYRDLRSADRALAEVRALWDGILGTIQVKTPDPSFDLLLNRWLLYQTLACRIWGRSAFYQSGGAFGFRDQLQDSMAVVYCRPDLTRAQILLHASRQFVEGDVQHWWHPPTGRGIRTRFSDDLLWLPYVTAFYIRVTGDWSVLDEEVPFLHGRPLNEGEDEYYDQPTVSEEKGSLYEHCLRALRRGLTAGPHGIPLMGSGDWNDGMNLVGNEGKGESIWVGWFLCSILEDFAPLCERRGDAGEASHLLQERERIRGAIETHAWDGEWYRRAYFDDGTPLGSKENEECRIDSIAQSWAIISGAGDPARAAQAMESVEKYLVREKDGLILLFTPPFDESDLNPGYIKGYVPGVRENGGQYTHAALWTVLATALMGKGKRAFELYSLINPIRHSDSEEETDHYKVEPYVVCADVYGAPPHTGRGGWTWYTGSASWMYRVGLESILGLQVYGDHFRLNPCIPGEWPGFEMTLKRDETVYRIRVENPDGVERGVRQVTLDGSPVPDGRVPRHRDGGERVVRVVMGLSSEP